MTTLRLLCILACLVIATNCTCFVPREEVDRTIHVFHLEKPKEEATKTDSDDKPSIIKVTIPERMKRETAIEEKSKDEILPEMCINEEDCQTDCNCNSETSQCECTTQSTFPKTESSQIVYEYVIPEE